MIWKLHSSKASKIDLSFVFALGFLEVHVTYLNSILPMDDQVQANKSVSFSDIIFGILRIIYLFALNKAEDYTWVAVDCWIWSVLEPSLAVVVACGPTLGPLIAALLRRVRTNKASSDTYPSYPERHQQFSNRRDSEYPLQPIYGNCSKADSKKGDSALAFVGTSPIKDVDQELMYGDLDRDVQPLGIRVE